MIVVSSQKGNKRIKNFKFKKYQSITITLSYQSIHPKQLFSDTGNQVKEEANKIRIRMTCNNNKVAFNVLTLAGSQLNHI